MKKLFLTLLTMPTVVGVLLPFATHSAHAAQRGRAIVGDKLCLTEHSRTYCVSKKGKNPELARKAEEIAMNPDAGIVFTDAESDAAVQRFGCDCPACIRAVKQIRMFTGVS
jgi:predicted secreted protein